MSDAAGFADLVAEVLEVDPRDVVDTAGPDTLTAWTSLRHLELVVSLQDEYGVTFSYQEIRNLKSIAQIRAVLRAKGADV